MFIYCSHVFSACIHAGIGLEQANNFLSTLNITPVYPNAYKKWHEDLASPLQKVTEESVSSALMEEKDLTL